MNKLPANKENFPQIISFGKEILELCRRAGVEPVIYGSLAYFFHTKDETLPVNDIDFLVPKTSFPELLRELKQMKEIHFEEMPYDSIEIFKSDLEMDLDAIERFLGDRSQETEPMEINGTTFQILNKAALSDIYREALENMPDERHLDEKREKYQRKLDHLKAL